MLVSFQDFLNSDPRTLGAKVNFFSLLHCNSSVSLRPVQTLLFAENYLLTINNKLLVLLTNIQN